MYINHDRRLILDVGNVTKMVVDMLYTFKHKIDLELFRSNVKSKVTYRL